jgi:hypothetical protein
MTIKGITYDKSKYKLVVYEYGKVELDPSDYQYIEKSDITEIEIKGNKINVYMYDRHFKDDEK